MKRLVIALLLLTLVGSAHAQTFSPSNFSKIKMGMSVKEVRGLLGKPVEEIPMNNGGALWCFGYISCWFQRSTS